LLNSFKLLEFSLTGKATEKDDNGGPVRKKTILTLILSVFSVCIVSAFIDGFDVLADVGTVKATGMLTSIEDDGTVIIDNKGYEVDPSILVVDRKGKSISLRRLSLPTKVRFEYIYDKTGFIIVFIQKVSR
jgi:hypothetical protein